MSENEQHEEEDPSQPHIHDMMAELIRQQDKMIKLLEQIAHSSGSKKVNNEDAPEDEKTSNDEDAPEDDNLTVPIRRRRLKLYRAALTGDWAVARGIYDVHEGEIRAPISKRKDTALHIAAAAKQYGFVKELVQRMEPRDLAQENNVGYTALFFAAASGMVELAREIMTHSKAIATEQDDMRVLPIDVAASLGHEDMVVYLYGQAKNSLNDEDRSHLLVTLIQTDLYDVALRVFEDLHEKSAIGRAANGETALHALARKNLNYSHFTKQYQRGFFSRVFNLGWSYEP